MTLDIKLKNQYYEKICIIEIIIPGLNRVSLISDSQKNEERNIDCDGFTGSYYHDSWL